MTFLPAGRDRFKGIEHEETGLLFGIMLQDDIWCDIQVTAHEVSVTVPAGEPVLISVSVPRPGVPFEIILGGETVEEQNYNTAHTLRLDQGESEKVQVTFTTLTSVTITAFRLSAQQHQAPEMKGVFGGGAPDSFVHDSPTPALEFTINVDPQLPPANPLPVAGQTTHRRRPRGR